MGIEILREHIHMITLSPPCQRQIVSQSHPRACFKLSKKSFASVSSRCNSISWQLFCLLREASLEFIARHCAICAWFHFIAIFTGAGEVFSINLSNSASPLLIVLISFMYVSRMFSVLMNWMSSASRLTSSAMASAGIIETENNKRRVIDDGMVFSNKSREHRLWLVRTKSSK